MSTIQLDILPYFCPKTWNCPSEFPARKISVDTPLPLCYNSPIISSGETVEAEITTGNAPTESPCCWKSGGTQPVRRPPAKSPADSFRHLPQSKGRSNQQKQMTLTDACPKKWPAEGTRNGSGQVFRNVQTYVSCRQYNMYCAKCVFMTNQGGTADAVFALDRLILSCSLSGFFCCPKGGPCP